MNKYLESVNAESKPTITKCEVKILSPESLSDQICFLQPK